MLSQSSLSTPEQSLEQTWVAFRLNQQIYALPIEAIVQIIAMVTITPIPRSSPVVEGVINVRGAATPVLNLHRYLGLPASGLQIHTPILLARVGSQTLGLIADDVQEVITFFPQHIVRPSDILPEGLHDVPGLQGMVYIKGQVVFLLDINNLFQTNNIQALSEAANLASDLVLKLEPEEDKDIPVVIPPPASSLSSSETTPVPITEISPPEQSRQVESIPEIKPTRNRKRR
jgi:purine-binding chemotaxis protein CheW